MIAQTNLATGARASRLFGDTGTVVATFSKRSAKGQERARYTLLDGVGLTRARAEQMPGIPGCRASVVWRDAKGKRVRSTVPANVDDAWVAQEDTSSRGEVGRQAVLNRVAHRLESTQRQLSTLVSQVEEWAQPTAAAQTCPCCDGDPCDGAAALAQRLVLRRPVGLRRLRLLDECLGHARVGRRKRHPG